MPNNEPLQMIVRSLIGINRDQSNLYFMIKFIIFSELRVDVNKNREIYYSFDSR